MYVLVQNDANFTYSIKDLPTAAYEMWQLWHFEGKLCQLRGWLSLFKTQTAPVSMDHRDRDVQ